MDLNKLLEVCTGILTEVNALQNAMIAADDANIKSYGSELAGVVEDVQTVVSMVSDAVKSASGN